jgi:hypothetical protein
VAAVAGWLANGKRLPPIARYPLAGWRLILVVLAAPRDVGVWPAANGKVLPSSTPASVGRLRGWPWW